MHLVEHYKGISKKEIIERLFADYDIDTTERTLERDFKVLKDDFGIDINYSHSKKGYELDKEASQDHLVAFFKFAELSSLAEVYEEGLKDFKSFQKWILPDDSSNFKGIDHIQTILHCIASHKTLKFKKENYKLNKYSDYEVLPLKLKEYENRWYLIAVPLNILEIRNFGLDRLSNLKKGDLSSMDVTKYQKEISNYNDIVGLDYNVQEYPGKIKLKVTANQIKYLKSLPLHHSQECVINEGEDYGEVSYFLKTNYEFEMQILKLGSQVEVLEPEFLRNRIKAKVEELYKLYV